MRDYQSQGLRLRDALEAFNLTRHQYYHRPPLTADGSRSRPGVAASTHTDHFDEAGICSPRPNAEVVEHIQTVQEDDDLRCGYKRMTAQLELRGYRINRKKVYRLMKQHRLLLSRAKKQGGPYVTHRCAQPAEPLTLFEMDIKMFWIEEHRRYAFVLTILDTFTRVALDWQVGYSMKWTQVRAAWERIIEGLLQEENLLAKGVHIEIRSDNGPQFLAAKLREFFYDNHLCQVFTHPYTPQENGHVESFHSILSRATQGDTFWTLSQLE
ncbi:DDE-type integrase/transposase/recombinase, partial [Neolewinella litorea]